MTDDLPRRPLFVRLTPPATVLDAPGPTNGIGKITQPTIVDDHGSVAELNRKVAKLPKAAPRKKLVVPAKDRSAEIAKELGAKSARLVETIDRDGVAMSAGVSHPSSKLVGVRLSADLLARLDAKRGDAGRQEFIRGILEFALPKLKAVP